MEEAKNKIESLLFATGRAMGMEEIAELTNLPKEQIEISLRELQNDYAEKESSLFLFHDNNTWKLAVKDKYLHILQKIVTETELDKSVTETLAVIAWKYPILQADVIKLRNNKAYDHLRQLEELGFIVREVHGRTRSIKLSPKFFEYFDLPYKEQRDKEAVNQSIPEAVKETVKLTEQEIENTEKLIEQKKMEKKELAKKSEEEKEKAREAAEELEQLEKAEKLEDIEEEKKEIKEKPKEKVEQVSEEEVANSFKSMFG